MTMTTTPPSGEPEAQGSNGRLRRVWQRRASRLTVVMVAAAVALTAAAVALAQGTGQFRDVPGNHYARDSVEWAIQNNITYGCGDGTYFCPETYVNRAQSVTFLHRYHNNVIRQLENRIRALESGSVQGSNPNTGFGNDTTPTTVPLRTFTTRGTQHQVRSFNLPAGVYDAVFTLEATKAAQPTIRTPTTDLRAGDTDPGRVPGVEQRVEDLRGQHAELGRDWRWHPADRSGAVPAGTRTGTVDVEIANVPGRLPTSGQIRVSAYMADDTITPSRHDADGDPDRTTKYDFTWGIILTEKR